MIILNGKIIVFQLIEWIGIQVLKQTSFWLYMLGFSYISNKSRHDKLIKPYLREVKTEKMNPQNY